ncbi:MAG: glycine-rich protein [Gammaproteobacteria bacterium]
MKEKTFNSLLLLLFPVSIFSSLSSATEITFNYTGSEQSWIVPAGVNSVTISANGAAAYKSAIPAEVSEGGHAQATFTVSPGETLYVYVGGKGGRASDQSSGNDGGGGFNGGGHGGLECTSGAPATNGYGGGGASDVRQGGNALADRIIVAGGAGGGAGIMPVVMEVETLVAREITAGEMVQTVAGRAQVEVCKAVVVPNRGTARQMAPWGREGKVVI